MSSFHFDAAKLIVLLLSLGLCLYSAVVKFAPATEKQFVMPSIPDSFYNKNLCDSIDRCDSCANKPLLQEKCRAELSSSLDSAQSKCSGYLRNWGTCQQSQSARQSQCRVEQASAEGCVKAVFREVGQRWASPQTIAAAAI